MSDNNELNITRLEDGIKFPVRVIPNSSINDVCGLVEGSLKIKLTAPPVEGKANQECIKFLSKVLGVPKSSVEIVSGETSKNKVILARGNVDELVSSIIRYQDTQILLCNIEPLEKN